MRTEALFYISAYLLKVQFNVKVLDSHMFRDQCVAIFG